MRHFNILAYIFLLIFGFSLLNANSGVFKYTNTDGKSFTYADLGTTRANDEENTKNIMTTYRNNTLPTGKFSIFNNFPDVENDTTVYPNNLGTHYLYSPEDFHYTKSTEDTLKSIEGGKPLGNRTPIILVHGWQGNNDSINPKSQIEDVDSPEEYWHNLITFFTKHHNLNNKYKIYVYKYPSYKHVSFNGQILKNMLLDENLIPELRDKEIIFISHSMGTIVVRSAFEEHSLPISKAKKIFFLAGVHHGSPASIPSLVRFNTDVKELYTLGANDIQWDNYDNLFTSESKIGKTKNIVKIDVFKNFVRRFTTVTKWSFIKVNRETLEQKGYTLKPKLEVDSDLTFEPLRFNFYGDKTNKISPIRVKETYYFDEFFRKKIVTNQNSNKYIYLQEEGEIKNVSPEPILYPIYQWSESSNPAHSVLPLIINPWLTYLNENYQKMSFSYKKKLLFYAGVNSNGTFIENNKLDDTWDMGLAEDGVTHLGELTCTSNCYGYLNDGPVPMTSALLDLKYSFDDLADKYNTSQVRVYQTWIDSDDASVKYYQSGDTDYIGDGYSKHVLFMDYHHNRMKSGAYSGSPSSLSYKTGFYNIWDRKLYIKNATKGKIVPEISELSPNSIYSEYDKNGIKYEPLFLSIISELSSISSISNCSFLDISKAEDYQQQSICKLLEKHIIEKKDNYNPTDEINRVEFLKIILFAELSMTKTLTDDINHNRNLIDDKKPSSDNDYFTDIPKSNNFNEPWYKKYVYYAKGTKIGNNNEHIINGYKDNTFRPNQPITFAEVSTIVKKLFFSNENSTEIPNYEKFCTEPINNYDWASSSIKILENHNIPLFCPHKKITRAEMAHIIYSVLKVKEN